MNQIPIDFEAARAGRDKGMKRAADHADSDIPGWSDAALDFLKRFAPTAGEFLAEDVRLASSGKIDSPPDNRAWGVVFNRAAKLGVIRKIGFAPCKTGHMRPMPVWVQG